MTELETLRRAYMSDEALARCVHEVHRAYNVWLDDNGPFMPPWDALSPWQKETVTIGVRKVRMGVGPEGIHKEWTARMAREGWTYGEDKNPERKEHPAMRDWRELPVWERRKAIVFCRIVYALTIEEW